MNCPLIRVLLINSKCGPGRLCELDKLGAFPSFVENCFWPSFQTLELCFLDLLLSPLRNPDAFLLVVSQECVTFSVWTVVASSSYASVHFHKYRTWRFLGPYCHGSPVTVLVLPPTFEVHICKEQAPSQLDVSHEFELSLLCLTEVV